jgi:RNA polymerase sigma-70 factor (ECF subfamily)
MTAAPLPGTGTFADFYARYHPRLRGFALDAWGAADADDIAQETMARALAAYDRLDPARDPWPWLVAIAKNIARDHHRRRRVIAFVGLESDEVVTMVAAESPHEQVADVEQRRLLWSALRNIAPYDRDVLLLRECHDVSFEELSRIYGRTPNALRQHALRARRRLADEFTALGGRALGAGTALAARWWRLRARAASHAGPGQAAVLAGAAVMTAVMAGALVAGGPAAGGGTRSGPGAAGPRAMVAAARRAAPLADAVRRPAGPGIAPPAVGPDAGARSPDPPVAVRLHPPRDRSAAHDDRVVVAPGIVRVELSHDGWSAEQRRALCAAPAAVRCGQT